MIALPCWHQLTPIDTYRHMPQLPARRGNHPLHRHEHAPSSRCHVDEATSALDTENEAAITNAITDDPQRRTRVIVAHRLSAIRNANQVLFIDDGALVEHGTVAELIALGGRFAEFWQQREHCTGWQILPT
jgi:ABC-type transport system involved in cytochrome bd biosynthesis fused ATPase/permease subunit